VLCDGGTNYDTGDARHGTDDDYSTDGSLLRLWLDNRTHRRIREGERRMATIKRTYQVIMTKVYEVKVEAESREQAEEIFDNFGDWEELLRVHTLDIEPADYLTLREED
jgi:hypothetical protein